jgi:hypothetical protein
MGRVPVNKSDALIGSHIFQQEALVRQQSVKLVWRGRPRPGVGRVSEFTRVTGVASAQCRIMS